MNQSAETKKDALDVSEKNKLKRHIKLVKARMKAKSDIYKYGY